MTPANAEALRVELDGLYRPPGREGRLKFMRAAIDAWPKISARMKALEAQAQKLEQIARSAGLAAEQKDAEIERLRDEAEKDVQAMADGSDTLDAAQVEITNLRAELAKARKVIKFYGDEDNHEEHAVGSDLHDAGFTSFVMMDHGDKARAYLESEPKA